MRIQAKILGAGTGIPKSNRISPNCSLLIWTTCLLPTYPPASKPNLPALLSHHSLPALQGVIKNQLLCKIPDHVDTYLALSNVNSAL